MNRRTAQPLRRRLELLPLLLLLGWVSAFGHAAAAAAPDAATEFDRASKLYEQGKAAEAAQAYESLLPAAAGSPALWFNCGNAHYKAGHTGRAIAAWRQAERLAPRDPGIQFNLAFARKRVSGTESAPGPFWQRALQGLTLNEWTLLVSCALWLWCGLLALRELKPILRPTLKGYTATAGVVTLLLATGLAGAAVLHGHSRPAVVIVPEAIARSGPLDEARVLHPLRDGTEVVVLDEKSVAAAGQPVSWLQVRDGAGRTGWVKADQLTVLK